MNEKQFRDHCLTTNCRDCRFKKDCLTVHNIDENFANNYALASDRFKRLVSFWRKQKLAKLLSQP